MSQTKKSMEIIRVEPDPKTLNFERIVQKKKKDTLYELPYVNLAMVMEKKTYRGVSAANCIPNCVNQDNSASPQGRQCFYRIHVSQISLQQSDA